MLAYIRCIKHDVDSVLPQLVRWADSRDHEQLGRCNGSCRQDDLARSQDAKLWTIPVAGEAYTVSSREAYLCSCEQDLLYSGVDGDGKVRPVQDIGGEICSGSRTSYVDDGISVRGDG